MTQNPNDKPRYPNPIENEDPENEAFDNNNLPQGLDDPTSGRPARPEAELAGDDPEDLENAVAALDEDEPADDEELGSGEDHERIPDRTQQRGYR
ncbi:MAG: hypothetical protein IOC49_15595 [Methylobacterium sp.]|nr:hypothetical protein [Methylobacterium sp.]